jgi:hypothetical protein
MTANLTEDPIRIPDAIHLIEAVAANDREHANASLELWARQPELARILGRVRSRRSVGSSTVCVPRLRGRA